MIICTQSSRFSIVPTRLIRDTISLTAYASEVIHDATDALLSTHHQILLILDIVVKKKASKKTNNNNT